VYVPFHQGKLFAYRLPTAYADLHNINSGLHGYAIRVVKQCGRDRLYFD